MAEVDGAVGVRQGARYQNFLRDLSHSEHYIFCCKRASDITKGLWVRHKWLPIYG